MIEKLLTLYRKYREPFWYLIVGGLTTLVDFVVYYTLLALTPLHYLVVFGIAWAAAVLFAFFPNRSLVFQSREDGILRQFGQFVSSRVATFIIGEGLLFLLVDLGHFSEGWMKPVVSVLIVVLNYVFSKWFVFK